MSRSTLLLTTMLFAATSSAGFAREGGSVSQIVTVETPPPVVLGGCESVTPSPLPIQLFDFETEGDYGAYPYQWFVWGHGDVSTTAPVDLVHSGSGSLLIKGEAPTRLEFAVPVERLEFMWRDETNQVKAMVEAFDVNGDRIFRAQSAGEVWLPFLYVDSTRPIKRLEFTTQSSVLMSAIDDLRIRARESATSFCIGDGSSSNCPCGNLSAPDSFEGCVNSTGRGVRMHALGSATAERAELRFYLLGLPAERPVMLLEGTQQGAQLPFNDGVLCLGHLRRRLGVAMSDIDGAATLGTSIFEGDQAPVAGEELDYQCWYRDPGVSSCGTGAGLSQAQRVCWH